MEIFDVVNEQDEVLGQASREECHSNPKLIHRVLHFTLYDSSANKIFLTQRAFGLKYDPGKFCFMGEHILTGESYAESVKRGVREELGFTPSSFKELGSTIFSYASQKEFARFYLINWKNEVLKPNPIEIANFEWLNPSDLNNARDYSEIAKYWISHINWKSLASI